MEISEASMYACFVEAGTFKPGNIYPGREGFFDLVVSGGLLGKTIERICKDGKGKGMGRFIKEAVLKRAQCIPVNTNLGIILLHVPLAVAACEGLDSMEKTVDYVTRSSTQEDAVHVVEALQMSGAHLGTPLRGPDVRSQECIKEIRERKMTLFDLFSISSEWDLIASEWVSGFGISFQGAEKLISGESVLELYLDILSNYPDSLVLRKFGKEVAWKVSRNAQELKGGTLEDLRKWDEYLYCQGINPGTTADLVASSLFVAFLKDEGILKRFLSEIGARFG